MQLIIILHIKVGLYISHLSILQSWPLFNHLFIVLVVALIVVLLLRQLLLYFSKYKHSLLWILQVHVLATSWLGWIKTLHLQVSSHSEHYLAKHSHIYDPLGVLTDLKPFTHLSLNHTHCCFIFFSKCAVLENYSPYNLYEVLRKCPQSQVKCWKGNNIAMIQAKNMFCCYSIFSKIGIDCKTHETAT